MTCQPHNCWEHARCITFSSIDSHGLDCGPFEHFTDEEWVCAVCGSTYTTSELMRELSQPISETEQDTHRRVVRLFWVVLGVCVVLAVLVACRELGL